MSRSLQGAVGGIAYVEYLEGEADGVLPQPLIKTSRLKHLQSKEVAIDNLFSVIKHNQWIHKLKFNTNFYTVGGVCSLLTTIQ